MLIFMKVLQLTTPYSNFNRLFRKIDHQNWTHPCFIWGKISRFHEEIKYKSRAVFEIVVFACILGLGLTGTKLTAKLKIQAKMTISKTARFFYLIFAWELLLNTYRGLGCAQFEWSIFLNRRWLLKRCDLYWLMLRYLDNLFQSVDQEDQA